MGSKVKKAAFSLVELTVVLFIIAAILAATVFSFAEIAEKNSKKSAYSVMEVAYNFLQSLDIKDDGIVNTYVSGYLVYKDPGEAYFYVCKVTDGVIDKEVAKKEETASGLNVDAYNGENNIVGNYILPAGAHYTAIMPCHLSTEPDEYSLSENVAFYIRENN